MMEYQSDQTQTYVSRFWRFGKKHRRSNLESKRAFVMPALCLFVCLVCVRRGIIIALHVLPRSIMAESETPDRPMGSRGSKKRKATVPRDRQEGERLVIDEGGGGGGGEEEEEEEEKKIEEFFALLNNFREARDRLACSRPALAGGLDSDDHKRRRRQVKGSVSAWDPRFRREDFMEEAVPAKKAVETLAFVPSRSAPDTAENIGGGGGGGGALDLRLSL